MGFVPIGLSLALRPEQQALYARRMTNGTAAEPVETPAPPVANPISSPSGRGELRLAKLLACGFFAVILFTLVVPLFSKLSWTTLVPDDFFYYLVVAQNLAHGHGSTFNGIVLTNGYQPLWFACIALLSFFTDNPRFIVAFIAVTSFAASFATFSLASRLFRKAGARPLLAFALAAWLTTSCLMLFCLGMEVTLTIPLVLAAVCLLCEERWLIRSPLHTFYLGLVLAAMVLSRIDTLILGALFLAGILLSPRIRAVITARLAVGALAGFSPVLLYFAFNRIFFHSWLPISGMAKQLKADHHVSALPFESLSDYFSGTVKLAVLAIAIALLLLPRLLPRLAAIERVAVSSLLIFPFVYYAVLSYVSDWGLWAWHWYALRVAFCAALVVLCLSSRIRSFLERPIVLAVIVLGAFYQVASHPWKHDDFDIDDAAARLRGFALTHPGVYAMGDRSGTVAYLLPYPVVQLEGLMMDPHFLDLIRAQVPLKTVLAQYHVRYYVATTFEDKPCFEAVEPALAGPHSFHMRGEFCGTPIFRFAYGHKITLVYDLGPPR